MTNDLHLSPELSKKGIAESNELFAIFTKNIKKRLERTE